MLILSRKVGQSIVINSNVDVKVVRVEDGQIELGIDAPKEVSVHREKDGMPMARSSSSVSVV